MKQKVMYSRCKVGLSPVKLSILSWPKKCWGEDAKPKWHRHCSDDHAGIIPLPDWPFNLHLWIIVPTTLICSSQYVCLTWHISSFGNCLEDVFELFVELVTVVLPCLCKECKKFPLDRSVSSNWLFCQDQDSGGSEVGFPVARRNWNRFGFGEADEELPCLGKWSIPSYMCWQYYVCSLLLQLLYMHHISIDDIYYHCQHHHVVHGEWLGNPPSLSWSGRSGRPTTDVAAWLTEESPWPLCRKDRGFLWESVWYCDIVCSFLVCCS